MANALSGCRCTPPWTVATQERALGEQMEARRASNLADAKLAWHSPLFRTVMLSITARGARYSLC